MLFHLQDLFSTASEGGNTVFFRLEVISASTAACRRLNILLLAELRNDQVLLLKREVFIAHLRSLIEIVYLRWHTIHCQDWLIVRCMKLHF